MKVAAVTILYNPDDKLVERIKSYAPFVGKLYLIDNSDESVFFIDKLNEEISSIRYIKNDENEGISKALNVAANLALKEGYDWLLTMDQDSFFQDGIFQKYLSCISNSGLPNHIAMYGIEYDERLLEDENCSPKSVPQLITSGSLLNLKIFKELGGFDEALFIDNVDHEYCFKAKKSGYENIKMSNIFLNHSLGITGNYRSFKTLKKTSRPLHSPLRIYYMVRNYLYLKPKYYELYKDEFIIIRKSLLYRIKNNFLYGNKQLSLLKHIIRGILDYKKGKMGKIS